MSISLIFLLFLRKMNKMNDGEKGKKVKNQEKKRVECLKFYLRCAILMCGYRIF